MPRRNHPRKRAERTSFERLAKEVTTDQMARELVRRGLVSVAVLGPRAGLRRDRQAAVTDTPDLSEETAT